MFIQITEEIILVQGSNGGRVPYSNSLLIEDERRTLVDTGADIKDLKTIATDYPPELIINTHFHFDHTRGNKLFPRVKKIAHPWEAKTLSSSKLFLAAAGLYDIGEEKITRGFYRQDLPIDQIDGILHDGDVLDFGKIQFEIIHTPGHTPGHLSLYCRQEGVLFAGDIDLTSFGPWYGNPGSNIEDFKGSIKRLRDLGPKIVLTGHGEPVKDKITEEFDRYLTVFEERDQRLLAFLKEPKTMAEIVDEKIVYRKHPEPVVIYRLYEGLLIGKHLQRLLERGLLLKEGDSYWNPWYNA
ncbi:MAG: MBL fold metallo-hydrolase [Bacillota bacterium]